MQKRSPTKQDSTHPQRLRGPSPEIKAVPVHVDLAIEKLKAAINDVVHSSSGRRIGVGCFPMCPALLVIGLDITECHLHVFATPYQHLPHGGNLRSIQIPKNLISKG